MTYDVLIVGGGPGGLSAALALGRARKRVLLCDSGPKRNAAATELHNFVTRDGTPPAEFRRIGREQLATYERVEVRDQRVASIRGAKGAFVADVGGANVEARRVILCTGMVDEMLPVEGFRELWGHAIYQCPYCHGWEVKERPWGYLATHTEALHFAVMLRSWTDDVTVFTNGALEFEAEQRERLRTAGIALQDRPIERLTREGDRLTGIKLKDGTKVACEALFAHPPQRQVQLVADLGLRLDEQGFVAVDPMTRETSVSGVYAAGDLTTRAQGAIMAAATGTQAAAMLNHELTAELVIG